MLSTTTIPAGVDVGSQIDFRGFPDRKRVQYRAASLRHLYYYLLHVDEYVDALPTAFEFATARLASAQHFPASSPELPGGYDQGDLERRLCELRQVWLGRRDEIAQSIGGISKEQCVDLLKEYAPTALLDGCWLQRFSSAATSHTELAAGMLKIYSHEIGDGDHALHHGNAFRDLMQSLGIYMPEVGSFKFIEQSDIADSAFSYPVFLLSISQFPRSFTPEILGLSLFHYVCGICPLYLALRDQLEAFGAATRFLDMHRLETSLDGLALTAVCMVRRSMEQTGGDRDHWNRIRRGFIVAHLASQDRIDNGVLFAHSPGKSPHEKMIELIARKSRHAYGYHSHALMDGRSLDDWMNPDQLDPEQFVRAFARSPYIKPGDSAGSLFFRQLIAFRGPMFRIFSPEELRVIARWIDDLPQHPEPVISSSPPPPAPHSPLEYGSVSTDAASVRPTANTLESDSIARYSSKPLGELYYHLLNIEFYPDIRPFAKHFATRWLAEAARGLRRGKQAIPFEPYEHQALDAWLEAQHSRQLGSYHEPTGEPAQSREEVIESTVQSAPMIFIDGARVQNASTASTSHTLVGSKLFHIYADEVGNGDVMLNHPNVYRELLAR